MKRLCVLVLFLSTILAVKVDICVDGVCSTSVSDVQVYQYPISVWNSLDMYYESMLMQYGKDEGEHDQSCIRLWMDQEYTKAISVCEREVVVNPKHIENILVLAICSLKTNQIQKAWDLLFLQNAEHNLEAALYLIFNQIYINRLPMIDTSGVSIYEIVYELVEKLYQVFEVRHGLRFLANHSKWHEVYKLTQLMLADFDSKIENTKNNNQDFWNLITLSALATNHYNETFANRAKANNHQLNKLRRYEQFIQVTSEHQFVEPEPKVNLSLPENQRKYYLSLCTMFKNESEFLTEFIEYYLMLGMEHFFLIANVNDDTYQDILQPYVEAGIVELFYADDRATHGETADICVMNHWKKTHWMAVIDIDEFLVTQDGRNIPSVLREYDAYDALFLSWKVMCTPVGMETESDLLIDRVLHTPDMYDNMMYSDQGKVIINTVYGRDMLEDGLDDCRYKLYYVDENKYIREKEGIADSIWNSSLCDNIKWSFCASTGFKHVPYVGKSSTISVTQRAVYGNYLFPPIHDVMYINHYAIKTEAEFVAKAKRGYSWYDKILGPDQKKWP